MPAGVLKKIVHSSNALSNALESVEREILITEKDVSSGNYQQLPNDLYRAKYSLKSAHRYNDDIDESARDYLKMDRRKRKDIKLEANYSFNPRPIQAPNYGVLQPLTGPVTIGKVDQPAPVAKAKQLGYSGVSNITPIEATKKQLSYSGVSNITPIEATKKQLGYSFPVFDDVKPEKKLSYNSSQPVDVYPSAAAETPDYYEDVGALFPEPTESVAEVVQTIKKKRGRQPGTRFGTYNTKAKKMAVLALAPAVPADTIADVVAEVTNQPASVDQTIKDLLASSGPVS